MAHTKDHARPMTEDELLIGITDALTIAGWRWTHARRSDRALAMGHQGWPDLFAVHPERRMQLALELKAEYGQPTAEQAAWLAQLRAAGLVAWLIRPSDYDWLLGLILGTPGATVPLGRLQE